MYYILKGLSLMSAPESPYTIRNASLEDVEAILTLENTIFPEDSNIGYRRLSRDIQNHAPSVKLAMLGDTIAGCVRGTMHPSQRVPDRLYGDISSIGVAAEHRRHGLGKLLLHEMIAEMRSEDPTGISLQTRVSNTAMQGLATQCGFTVEATLENYYGRTNTPEDAFQMVLRFGPQQT